MWNEGPLGTYKHSLLKLWIKTPISKEAMGSSFTAYRKLAHALIILLLYAHQFSWEFSMVCVMVAVTQCCTCQYKRECDGSFLTQSPAQVLIELVTNSCSIFTGFVIRNLPNRPIGFQIREKRLTLHCVLNTVKFGQMIISICLCEVATVIPKSSYDWSRINTLLSQSV